MAEHNEIGKIGENMTKTFLMKQGFDILEQNYRIFQGEIDIIAKKDNILHFVEVKSVKVRDCNDIHNLNVTPEDNLTYAKWSKILIAVGSYLKKHTALHVDSRDREGPQHQIDLACVYINPEKREGRVRLLQNIHKERI